MPHPRPEIADLFTPGGLLTTTEVAAIFHVDIKTVTRWSRRNPPRLKSIRTLGGHRRFYADEVRALLHGQNGQVPQ